MKKIIMLLSLCLCFKVGFSQVNCGMAVQQLQQYAAQVNQIYSNEYWNIIPNQRCPAVAPNGFPYDPGMVQNCRYQTLGQLNNWYTGQCNYVNNWYRQIAHSCGGGSIPQGGPAPGPNGGQDENDQIDTADIGELGEEIDEDQVVSIKIPKTAAGFKGR